MNTRKKLLWRMYVHVDVHEYQKFGPDLAVLVSVAATLTETKQFYTLYNTLEDQKAFMEKEV